MLTQVVAEKFLHIWVEIKIRCEKWVELVKKTALIGGMIITRGRNSFERKKMCGISTVFQWLSKANNEGGE